MRDFSILIACYINLSGYTQSLTNSEIFSHTTAESFSSGKCDIQPVLEITPSKIARNISYCMDIIVPIRGFFHTKMMKARYCLPLRNTLFV